MSDNKVNGAGSNSWGLSTLVEAAMGEPEATTTSDAGAPAQKEVARNQQDSSQQDSFEQDGGSEADDFMAWAGAKATSMSEDASKLIDEGMETVSTTVGDLLQGAGDAGTGSAPISEKHVDGLRDLSKVVDRTASEIREAANDVSQTVEDVEILDAETNRKLDRLASMDAKEFFSMGLDEIGLDAGKRAEIEQRIDHRVSIARESMGDPSELIPWEEPSVVVTKMLGAAADVLEETRESLVGTEERFQAVEEFGEDVQAAGTAMLVVGIPAAPLVTAMGVTLEMVGQTPELLDNGKDFALGLQAGAEGLDPDALAGRVADLEDGESVVYSLKAGFDIHKGVGVKGEVSGELKIEKKGEKFIAELKGTEAAALGIGAKALGEGISADLAGAYSGSIVIECDSAEAVKKLSEIINAGTHDSSAFDEIDYPDSINIKKLTLSGEGGGVLGADAKVGEETFAGLGLGVMGSNTIGISNDKMGDGKADFIFENGSKLEASASLGGVAGADRVSPREVRQHLANLEDGNISKFIDELGPDASKLLSDSLVAKPGDQLKATMETKFSASVPVKGVENAQGFVEGMKFSYEEKLSLVVGGALVEAERKIEVKDPIGLAKALGTSVEKLAQQMEAGSLGAEELNAHVKDIGKYLTIEDKVQQRNVDTVGIIGVKGFTASRAEFSKPVEIFSYKLDDKGVTTGGAIDKAIDKHLESRERAEKREFRMSDFTHHVIKG